MAIKDTIRQTFVDGVLRSGKRASSSVYRKRMAICSNCVYKGTVNVLGMTFDGCTACGCPFDTKARMLTIAGQKITCAHPDGDKWANITNHKKQEK